MVDKYRGKKVDVEYNLCGEMRTACYVMEHAENGHHLEFLYRISSNNIAHLEYVKYNGREDEPAGTPLMVLKYVELAKEAVVRVEGIEEVEPFLETIKDQLHWN